LDADRGRSVSCSTTRTVSTRAIAGGPSAPRWDRHWGLVNAVGFMNAFKRSSTRLAVPRWARGPRPGWRRIRHQVRRAMRRFEPATRRVRRLRSSFTIPTSPGRNARTVSGF